MNKHYIIMSVAIFITVSLATAIYLESVSLQNDLGSSPAEGLLNCNKFAYSNEGAINLLYFGTQKQVEEYNSYFFRTPPYTEYEDRFNINYIDNYFPECDTYRGIATFCHSRTLLKRAASCPNDYIIVLVPDLPSSIRSSSYLNVISVNLAHPLTVLIHEFAHSFSNLADEYVPAGKLPRGQLNCAEQCEDFNGLENGCFEGCTDNSHIRSIENGVMRTLSNNTYGNFNEYLVTQTILELSSDSSGTTITGRQVDDTGGEVGSCYLLTVGPDGIKTREKIPCRKDDKKPVSYDTTSLFTDAPQIQIPEESELTEETIDGETYNVAPGEFKIAIVVPENQKTIEVTLPKQAGEEPTASEFIIAEIPEAALKVSSTGTTKKSKSPLEIIVRTILPSPNELQTTPQHQQPAISPFIKEIINPSVSKTTIQPEAKLTEEAVPQLPSSDQAPEIATPDNTIYNEQEESPSSQFTLSASAIAELSKENIPVVAIFLVFAVILTLIILRKKFRR